MKIGIGNIGISSIRQAIGGSVAATVGVPTPISTQGDSWSVRASGQIPSTDYASTVTSRGLGGSLMTAAITRWQSDVVNHPNDIHFFLDGIYDDYVDEATFITNLNNIATAANNAGVTWFFVGSGHPQPGGAEYPGNTIALAVLALTDTALSLYPDNVVDFRATLQALNDGSANDLADVAAGLLPRSIFSDTLHVGNGGDSAIAQLIADTATAAWPQVAQYVPSDTLPNILGANLISDVDPATSAMLQTTGGAAATADGDPVQVMPDLAGGADWTALALGERPTLRISGGVSYLEANASFMRRALSRTGDLYVCMAVRAYANNSYMSGFYNTINLDAYEQRHWNFGATQWALTAGDGTDVQLADDGSIQVLEFVYTATERDLLLRKENAFVESNLTTTTNAMASTSFEKLFGIDSGDTFGTVDLFRRVVVNRIPTDAERDDIIHTVAASAGLVLLPPGSEDG